MAQRPRPTLPEDARREIRERRESLEQIVADDGPFSPHAELLLELASEGGG